jgi:hypothetical protein
MAIVVYKYLEAKFLGDLLNGEIYLNTFYDLKDFKKELIGDEAEGTVNNQVNYLHIPDSSDIAHYRQMEIFRASGLELGNSKHTTISNCSFKTSLPNAHVYCVSQYRNDEYWSENVQYNCCVVIKDFKLFCRRILQQLQFTHESFCADVCFYEDNTGNIEAGTAKFPHYFRKTEKHRFQKEVRLVIKPFFSQIIPFKPKIFVDDIIELVRS